MPKVTRVLVTGKERKVSVYACQRFNYPSEKDKLEKGIYLVSEIGSTIIYDKNWLPAVIISMVNQLYPKRKFNAEDILDRIEFNGKHRSFATYEDGYFGRPLILSGYVGICKLTRKAQQKLKKDISSKFNKI
ncbi:MAG: hypothetical protein ACE5ES_05015 [Candidatus Nanoarchaeia archaeon]